MGKDQVGAGEVGLWKGGRWGEGWGFSETEFTLGREFSWGW